MKHTPNTMKRIFLLLLNVSLLTFSLSGCIINLDPANSLLTSKDEIERTYSATDLGTFDRLDMGSAYVITVVQSSTPSMTVKGDREDVNDLEFNSRSGTLNVRYNKSRIRRYNMKIIITMPTLRGVSFSGATKSDVSGFRNLSDLSIELSGASKGYFNVQANNISLDLSGASKIDFSGSGNTLRADVSGASELDGFGYPFADATLDVSGASHVYVTTSNSLNVTVTGASKVRYRGSPAIKQSVSGASKVEKD